MTIDPKITVVLLILLFNLLHFFNQKSRIISCLNAVATVFLLILLLSFVVTSQILFRNIALLMLIFLAICIFIIVRQDEIIRGKKDVKKNSFSFGYFLLVTVAVIGVFISVSFLITIKAKDSQEVNKIEVIKKIDVNNAELAKKKYDSKTSLFDEKDLVIKLFKGLSDMIIAICCLFSLMLCVRGGVKNRL